MEKSHESALFPGVMPVFEMTSEKGKYLYRYNYGANNAGNEMNKTYWYPNQRVEASH